MNKIRFGLIGCGDIAHIRYFYSIPHFEEIELVGIYDMNKPFLQKTAEELGVKAFNSYEEMLDDPTIDAVIVTTYHPLKPIRYSWLCPMTHIPKLRK